MRTYPVYLNGDWRVSGDSSAVVNPATGDVFARMSVVDRSQIALAIKDAHASFAGWRATTARSRGEALNKIAAELYRRRGEIARIITLENGKPIAQSQGEVAMAVDHLRWFGEEARRVYGRIVPQQVESKRHLILKSPVGVVAAISPWNFPLMLAVRKIAPALAAGCPVILKPSRYTPLSSVALAECVHTVSLPPGVFQLVAGNADEIGQEFLENPLCRKITFTGSTEVGKKLIEGAARHVKPLSLELGGNAPLLVFDDCPLKTAIKGTLMAKFRNTGQSCIAANRIYVQRGIYNDFVTALAGEVRSLVVGEGIDPESEIGPLIDEAAVERAQEHVSDAIKGGAKLVCGGNRREGRGFFFEPTVLEGVGHNSLCMYEETFAPIAPITPFDSEREAIELANRSNFGLSAYVFTLDVQRMFHLAENLDAGTIGINDGLPTTSQCPFGGMKQSGWGRELGTEGIDAFLETKHVSLDLE